MFTNSLRPTRTVCAALLPLMFFAARGAAQDDRDRDTPVGTYWSGSLTTSEITTRVNQGWRLTDLEIVSTSPATFSVAMVPNSGAYAKAWWWYPNVTGAQLATALQQNNARLIDLEPFDDQGTTRFAAIMISNTGSDARGWWWLYDQTATQIQNFVSQNGARLLDLERYTKNGATLFAAVMIPNTGSDNRFWGYWFGASLATIENQVAQNNMRVYSLERVGTDSYDAILIRNASFGWWYYFGRTAAQVTELLEQNVARLIDVERYSTLLGTRYDVVMIDNANTLERRAWSQFGATDGAYGAYLEDLNGSVLAQVRPDFQFEPASLLKTLLHAHAMRQVQLGNISLSTMISVPLGTVGSCPNLNGSSINEPLSTVLRRMMENSDNNRTYAIERRFGRSAIQATATALGMGDTSFNHTIGCGTPPNALTLRDLADLHDVVANGWLGQNQDTFYDLMNNGLSFPTWGTADLSTRVATEVTALGLPAYVRDAFLAETTLAFKPGGYAWNGLYYFSEGGYVSVPFKNSLGVITRREYAFGAFNHGASVEVSARNATSNAALELVWDRVRAALATWDNEVTGSFASYGIGCVGSAGTPSHSATGTPSIGSTVTYRLALAPPGRACFLAIGLSNTSWSGLSLPASLDLIGAPGCSIAASQLATTMATVQGDTRAAVPFQLAIDPSFVGRSIYTQFLVIDPAANALGLTTTNGVRTLVGGYR